MALRTRRTKDEGGSSTSTLDNSRLGPEMYSFLRGSEAPWFRRLESSFIRDGNCETFDEVSSAT